MKSTSGLASFVCVVDFHHARGPEVEAWVGVPDSDNLLSQNDWSLLPFMALSDGAHAALEEFSYFTLPYHHSADPERPISTSLFGISCTRQLDSDRLVNKPDSVTRSTVQKAVVVISDSPQFFSLIKEKLSIVTSAWFNQCDFSNLDILVQFQASLADQFSELDPLQNKYFGLSFRELIYRFKHQSLVLFKACLLQRKILFYGATCEKVCLAQFALLSLIPGLLQNLHDCAEPGFDSHERTFKSSSSLQSSDRSSLLAYMGLPLHLFGKGSFFGPYIPLQMLDLLADHGTQSFIAGSTNSLLLQQKDRYCEVFVNMDDYSIQIAPHLKSALSLTVADRRWIDGLTQAVMETWDEENPTRPNTMKYFAGEDFLRVQFEDYLMALTSAAKYHQYLEAQASPKKYIPEIGERDPFLDFGIDWTAEWSKSTNYALFDRITDADIFNVVQPIHPCAGNLTLSDLQRRMNHQLTELHWDEKIQQGQDAVKTHLATGQKKISAAFNRILSEIDERRKSNDSQTRPSTSDVTPTEAEGPKVMTAAPIQGAASDGSSGSSSVKKTMFSPTVRTPDMSGAQATVKAASAKANAYISSWSSWAAEKRSGWSWPATANTSRAPSPRRSTEKTDSKAPAVEPSTTSTGRSNTSGLPPRKPVNEVGGSVKELGRSIHKELPQDASDSETKGARESLSQPEAKTQPSQGDIHENQIGGMKE